MLGPSDPVPIFPGSEQFDFELEVGAVIGRAGHDINPNHGWDHIAGYTIYGDWSARGLQRHEMRLSLGPAKGKDGANTIGPLFVTADEIAVHRTGNGFHLRMNACVNGKLISEGWLDQMDWSFAEMVAYASRGAELRPGDVLGSGTVPTGCLYEHFAMGTEKFDRWLQAGDQVRLAVEHLVVAPGSSSGVVMLPVVGVRGGHACRSG
ncbi:fumarylacetoacetate hydrolase family protein [Amycolatopsis pithecellobii]|uniref:fumarylacetoacetate hydrolase family protein n=1 Tax=Amycolatopsis pithecellobii TaxID=664692 RepID=UPI0028AB8E12|nr:fumarylacetoacetate hydrolase family protein [Amycolatopsis pithecellobii]